MNDICLVHVKENRYRPVDCKTGSPIGLGPGRGKRIRAPSKYNIFMGSCIKRKTGPIQKRFKSCATEYKKKK